MEQITEKVESICGALKKINSYTRTSGPCFNSLFIRERKEHIAYLGGLADSLNALLSRIENAVTEANYYQDIDVAKVTRVLGDKILLHGPAERSGPISMPENDSTWIDEIDLNASGPTTFTTVASGPKLTAFGPADGIGPELAPVENGPVLAQIIKGPNEIRAPGQLYYIEGTRHFAVKFTAESPILHGNIGRIYRGDRSPRRVKNCMYARECTNANCTYFHDPFYCPTDDIRNFVASGPGPVLSTITTTAALLDTLEGSGQGPGPDSEERWAQLNSAVMMGILLILLAKSGKKGSR